VTSGVLDTSVFIAIESGRRLDTAAMPERLRVSVITIGELRLGVLAADRPDLRARRLTALDRAAALEPVPVSQAVAEAWALLRVGLHAVGRSMPLNDSWIAATAMSLGVPVVTQDADYDSVPGLDVIRV
jgi:predicted nucleic acid-binding protein